MSAAPSAIAPRHASAASTVVLCRDADSRAEIAQVIPGARAFTSAVEGVLAVVREKPEAVVVDLANVEGREADLLDALGRARPGVRVYLLAGPASEPRARSLLKSGAAGYVVMPGGADRLAALLSPAPPEPAVPAAPAEPQAGAAFALPSRWASLFEASCAMASLAPCHADTILREAAHILAEATGARRTSIYTRRGRTDRLERRETLTARGVTDGHLSDFERSCAARGTESLGPVFFPLQGPDAAGGAATTLVAIPMRECDEPLGVVCLLCPAEECASPQAWQPIARIVGNLARLYRAAQRRETTRV